ncbi:unnamed protein product [Arctia plantaginis]|uniref:Uncharacterized protein n=1 Tax=Arctia plantaginis TaxID=874455 RepID=A0A8S0YRM3_ARCPL|nr:unnamed protein product [Arctia plantaginis]CAB3232278.1 unnamed protein product [Arctia plantaginis]
MKKRLISTDEEKKYIYKIINPDNLFCDSINEEMTYSKEHGCLTVDSIETPNCIFRYCKRSNRSFRGKNNKIQAEKEKANSSVFNLINVIDPTIFIEFPSSSVSIQNHLISVVQTLISKTQLEGKELERVKQALYLLHTCQRPELRDSNDFWENEERD